MFRGLFAEYCISNVDETKNIVLQPLLVRMLLQLALAEVKLRFIVLLVCLIIFENFLYVSIQETILFFSFFYYSYSSFCFFFFLLFCCVCLFSFTYLAVAVKFLLPKYSFVRNAMFKVIHNFFFPPMLGGVEFSFYLLNPTEFEWVIC